MKIVLGNEGIRELQRILMDWQRVIDEVVNEAERRLAEEGQRIMLQKAPTTDIDGNIPGRVRVEPRAEGYAVTYLGQDVAYIEFGTGITGMGSYPDGEVLAEVNWTYDVNDHGEKGWYYYGKRDGKLRHSRGMRGEKPVLETYRETERLVPDIVRKVMNEKLG